MRRIAIFSDGSADFTQRVELGGALLDLRLTWNTRSGFWYLRVGAEGETFGDIKVVSDWPLLSNLAAVVPFEGDFLALRLTKGTAPELTYAELGRSYGLFWVGSDELERWRASNGF